MINLICEIVQFERLTNFHNIIIRKINILQFKKMLNILDVQTISKKWKINLKIKLSNNSSFVILIFAILKFRNIGRSAFRRSKFWPSPEISKKKIDFLKPEHETMYILKPKLITDRVPLEEPQVRERYK